MTGEKKFTPSAADDESDQWLGTTSDDTDIIVLHRFFDKHADKIGKELLSLSKPTTEGDTSAISGKRAWDGLCALLVDLGPPLEVPRLSSLSSENHRQYMDLVSRCADKDTRRVAGIFVAAAVPVVRFPLLHLIQTLSLSCFKGPTCCFCSSSLQN